MKATHTTLGAAALALGFLAGPATAQPPGGASAPPFGVPGGPEVVAGAPFAGSFLGTLLEHGPIGCYFTRVRANNRWLRAQICDWNPGFGAP